MISQLGISERKKLKVPAANSNTIFQGSIDSGVYLIELFSVGRGLNFLLVLVCD